MLLIRGKEANLQVGKLSYEQELSRIYSFEEQENIAKPTTTIEA